LALKEGAEAMSILPRSSERSGSSHLLLFTLILLPAFACLSLFAQQDAGGLVVSVRDPNGAIVQVAKVVVTNDDTNQTMEGTTIDTGDYTASPLRPGRYEATVKQAGFQTAVSEPINIGAQQIPRMEIKLAVG